MNYRARPTEMGGYYKKVVLKKEFEEGRITQEEYNKYMSINHKSYASNVNEIQLKRLKNY